MLQLNPYLINPDSIPGNLLRVVGILHQVWPLNIKSRAFENSLISSSSFLCNRSKNIIKFEVFHSPSFRHCHVIFRINTSRSVKKTKKKTKKKKKQKKKHKTNVRSDMTLSRLNERLNLRWAHMSEGMFFGVAVHTVMPDQPDTKEDPEDPAHTSCWYSLCWQQLF